MAGRKKGAIKNPEKGGQGKAMIAASGGGRRALAAYRALPSKSARLAARTEASVSGKGLTKVVRSRVKPAATGRAAETGVNVKPASRGRARVSGTPIRASSPAPSTSSSRGRQGPPKSMPKTGDSPSAPAKPMGSRGYSASRGRIYEPEWSPHDIAGGGAGGGKKRKR